MILLPVFLSLLATAFAIPTPSSSDSGTVDTSSKGGTYFCTATSFNGVCLHVMQPLRRCEALDADWQGKVNSFTSQRGFSCRLYDHPKCYILETIDINTSGIINKPGVEDLATVHDFGGKAEAVMCWRSDEEEPMGYGK
ncbi:hypothetical protein K402DRAFT_449703 [Aulographum hederae CBS 113979]|uniref:Uncharacterized protein n=1 Tax=Aulographum hederae CBS 113979 TaxID=1176131 RepID=A0A6G1HGH6_9PEZI|nr:hypothetical protein K402DRAFT_449703 [Aulographum hederae CBS 113979]